MLRGARAFTAAAVATGVSVLMVGVADASAASLFLCVPSTAGQPAVSGGSSASGCGSGTTAVNASILSHASYTDSGIDGQPTITFTGVNVQVVSGSGSTSGAVNGAGNLIIGYAEDPSGHPQTGSNDLILGSNNGWSSYGELIGGSGDQASGAFASVLGDDNTASGSESSVAGGESGLASTTAASVGGGNHDTASGSNGAWAAGGYENVSSGSSTAVTGGAHNRAQGANSSVAGGESNSASGSYSAVTGGQSDLASDPFASISGGCQGVAGTATALTGSCGTSGYESISGGVLNKASGPFSSVSAGLLNQAEGYSTAVSGGDHNTAGSSSLGDYASVTGGGGNDANGDESAIAGGQYNLTTDDNSFVAGGCDNLAGAGTAPTGNCVNSDSGIEDGHDVVLGGFTNTTTGFGSSISGGEQSIATDVFSSITGGCDNLTGSGTVPSTSCATSGMDTISGGDENNATGSFASISGGSANSASGGAAWIGGGSQNTASTGSEASIAGGQSNSATGSFSAILGGDGISLSKTNGVSPAGLVSSVTGTTTFSLGANACGPFTVSDGDLQPGDVPLFAYTTTPPTGHMLLTPGAVLTAGKATYTVCNDSSSAGSFNGSIHVVAFRG